MNDRPMILRFSACIALYAVAAGGLGARLAFLHLGPHAELRHRISDNRQIEQEIKVRRGSIYDRAGEQNILAMDLTLKDVCADPQTILASNRVADVAETLSQTLDLPADEVAVRLNAPGRRYARIQPRVLDETAERLAQRQLPGVFFRDVNTRYYPQRTFLCHVLGFVNREAAGSAGVELRLNGYLKGTPGMLESQVNAKRQELYWQRGRHVPALDGADVRLTIDQNVQNIVERVADGLMEEHHARGVWVIVERVGTGEIVAMVSRPAYDLNEFGSASEDERLNRAIGTVYEPGSTMKAVTFAAVLNEELVTPETVFDCENGAWSHAGRILRDYHPYGNLTVADGIKKSSNIMTAKLALMLGNKRLAAYFAAFGLGAETGIDLPGEECGILHPVRKWSKLTPSRIAIGQGVAATALQILNLYCAIANDGHLMRPYIVSEVRARDGTVLLQNQPHVVRSVIRPRTATVMRQLLGRVTEVGGTGRRAQVEGFTVAGKTGTAQKPVAGGYSATDHVASFVGFLPAENPELGIIVVVDEPQPLHTGGVVAAPAFSAIAGEAVRCLGIRPAGYAAAVAAAPTAREGGI